jgi:hypothetical protein
MRFWLGIAIVLLEFGCVAPSPREPIIQQTAAPILAVGGSKRIVRDGAEGFILPDGTRVRADEKGGFRLPNGGYVSRLADGLLLPNGVQCLAE